MDSKRRNNEENKYLKINLPNNPCKDVSFSSATKVYSNKKKEYGQKKKCLEERKPNVITIKESTFLVCPPNVVFTNCTTGHTYKQILKLRNVSSKISRITFEQPKLSVFKINILHNFKNEDKDGEKSNVSKKQVECEKSCMVKLRKSTDPSLHFGKWSAALGVCIYLEVCFSPISDQRVCDELIIKVQGGDEKIVVPIESFKQPPFLYGFLSSCEPPDLSFSNFDFTVDRLEIDLGYALINGEIKRQLVLLNLGGDGSFIIIPEKIWKKKHYHEISYLNELVVDKLYMSPKHFSIKRGHFQQFRMTFKSQCKCFLCPGGRGCFGCGATSCYTYETCTNCMNQKCSALGPYSERLTVVCDNGITQTIQVTAEAIQFPKKPIRIHLPGKVYDIDIDGDSGSQFFLDLGVILPGDRCKTQFNIENISDIPLDVRWNLRRSTSKNHQAWPVGCWGPCGDKCGWPCANTCHGLCSLENHACVVEPHTNIPVEIFLRTETFPVGKYSVVLGLIINDIPEASLPPNLKMKRIIRTKYSIQDLQKHYIAMNTDLLAYEIECWLEVKNPEVFINPCIVQITSEPLRRCQGVIVCRTVTVCNLSKYSLDASWKIEPRHTRLLDISPRSLQIPTESQVECTIQIKILTPLCLCSVLILNINNGLLAKELIVKVNVEAPSFGLNPSLNQRVELLPCSNVIELLRPTTPPCILSLPIDILYLDKTEITMVVLRNQTHELKSFQWEEPIGSDSKNLLVTIFPKEGSIRGKNYCKIYIHIVPLKCGFVKNFIIPCIVGNYEQTIPLVVLSYVDDLHIEFKIVDENESDFNFVSDWIPWSKGKNSFLFEKISILDDYITSSVAKKSDESENLSTNDSKFSDSSLEMTEMVEVENNYRAGLKSSAMLFPFIPFQVDLSMVIYPLAVEFYELPLNTVLSKIILVHNKTPVSTYLKISVDNFHAIVRNDPENLLQSIQAKLFGKNHVDILPDINASGFGLHTVSSSSQLPPNGTEQFTVQAVADTWGRYMDTINIMVDSLPPLPIRVMADVVGHPLVHRDNLRFGSYSVGSLNVTRHIQIHNTSSLPLLINWHVFKYDEDAKDGLPFNFILNIGSKALLSSKTSSQILPQYLCEPEMDDYPRVWENMMYSCKNSSDSDLRIYEEDFVIDKITPFQFSSQTLTSSLSDVNHLCKCKPPITDGNYRRDEIQISKNISTNSDSSVNLETLKDIDVKMELCLIDHYGKGVEDYFTLHPRQMFLAPKEKTVLSVTLIPKDFFSIKNITFPYDFNITLIGHVQCEEINNDQIYRTSPPDSIISLSGRIVLPKVLVCEQSKGLYFTIHALQIFASEKGFLRLCKSLTLYNPNELPADGYLNVMYPFSTNVPNNTFKIPPESSFKFDVECMVKTKMCTKDAHAKQLKETGFLCIIQDYLPHQYIKLELTINFPQLHVEPVFIDFGSCQVGKTVVRYIKIQNLSEVAMECFCEVSWSNLGFWHVEPSNLKLQPLQYGGPKPDYFTLTFAPRYTEGNIESTVLISTGVPHCHYQVKIKGHAGIQRNSSTDTETSLI